MQRYCGVGYGLALHFDVFFCFDRLMQTVGVATARHEPSRELIHDYDLAVLHNIVAVALEYGLRLERVLGIMNKLEVVLSVDVSDIQHLFELGDALVRKGCRAVLLVDGIVVFKLQGCGESGEASVFVG